MQVQWFWLVVVAQAAGTGLLGLVLGGVSIQHDNRLSNLEWLQTVPLDERIEARERQRAYEEAEVLRETYGVRNRAASMPLARRLGGIPSGPMGPVSHYTPLPADPWAHNGYHDMGEDAEWRA